MTEPALLAPPLTARQQQVYDLICSYIEENDRPPSIRELMKLLGIRSINGMVCHLRALETKGLLSRIEGRARCLRPCGEHQVSRQGDQVVLRIPGRCSLRLAPALALELARALSHAARSPDECSSSANLSGTS